MSRSRKREYEARLIPAHSLSFEEWVEFQRDGGADVHWNESADVIAKRTTKLFNSGPYLLQTYSHDELNQLMWEFIGASGCLNDALSSQVPDALRLECIGSIKQFYLDVFVPNCTRALSHVLREPDPNISVLNSICYMWWDIFPSWGAPDDPHFKKTDEAILELLEELLWLPHLACQESALHGLGHWHLNYPGQVEKKVNAYLQSKAANPALDTYARSAACGCVN